MCAQATDRRREVLRGSLETPGALSAVPRGANQSVAVKEAMISERGNERSRATRGTRAFSMPNEWTFVPEGAAILAAEGVAVISDVHLGYEWSRGAGGDCVPAHSLAETLAKLTSLLSRGRIGRLIVAGDLVESAVRCDRTNEDVERFRGWLGARGVDLMLLKGNHDPPHQPALAMSVEVGGWAISHGHYPVAGQRRVIGHYHPVIRTGGVSSPCFLAGPRLVILPAFSSNAAGLDVGAATLPVELRGFTLRCMVCAGEELLDFGLIRALRKNLRGC